MRNLSPIFSLLVLFCGCHKTETPTSPIISPVVGEVTSKVLMQGRIRAENSVLVRAPVEAQLVKLYKSLGDSVDVGEPIVAIVQPNDESKVTGLIQAKGNVQQLQLQKERLRVKLQNAKREFESMKRLGKTGSVSKGEIETAKVARDLLVKEMAALEADAKTAQGTMEAKRKSNDDRNRTLTSPAKGVITQLWTAVENITPGMTIAKDTVIVAVEEQGQFQFKGDVVEADYLKLKVGSGASVALVHDPAKQWPGSVKSISPLPKQDASGIGRFDIVISIQGKQEALKSGLEARAEVPLSKIENVLRLPRSAVKEQDGHHWVSQPGDGAPVMTEVKIGAVGDQYIEIRSGLEASSKVYQAYVK